MKTVFGIKLESARKFTTDGVQVPVTRVMLCPMTVTQLKNEKKDGYQAIQFGIGEKKLVRIRKPQQGHIKGAKLEKAPLYFREVRVEDVSQFKLGDKAAPAEVLAVGDLVNVVGTSKGKGFTGVMKRWNFAGGPRTHGQSDRQRAPGSIGQTTTPGRVFKGKKMAGRAGGARKTVRNLQVLALDEEKGLLLVKGLIPGARNGLVEISKVGKTKNFVSLMGKDRKITGVDEGKKKEIKEDKKKEVAASQGENAKN